MTKLSVATCQFPVSADIGRNLAYVLAQTRFARRAGAAVAHFPEACLSGYAGSDLDSLAGLDWSELTEATERVREVAAELGIWVALGSTHRLSGEHKPHNSLYFIDDRGEIVERYDKRFCGGDAGGTTGDLAHYSPGDHGSIVEIDGVCCGALICYDYRFPELYREYKRAGVEVVFHSFHAANITSRRMTEMREAVGGRVENLVPGATPTYPGITMPASMTAAAASNHLWISCPNSSARESAWASFFMRADGVMTGRLRRNVAGVLLSEVDTSLPLYDSTAAWRDRALSGVLHSGELVADERSARRTRP